jgi:hypothetical protein
VDPTAPATAAAPAPTRVPTPGAINVPVGAPASIPPATAAQETPAPAAAWIAESRHGPAGTMIRAAEEFSQPPTTAGPVLAPAGLSGTPLAPAGLSGTPRSPAQLLGRAARRAERRELPPGGVLRRGVGGEERRPVLIDDLEAVGGPGAGAAGRGRRPAAGGSGCC